MWVNEKQTVVVQIASALGAWRRVERKGYQFRDVAIKWKDTIKYLRDEYLPVGSGFDAGTELDFIASTPIDGDPEKLVFNTSFHHMDENGGYDGWTTHQVIVTPSFDGINIEVTGDDRNDIIDYIASTFHDRLLAVPSGVPS